jgi:hypothetical protein
MQDPAADRARKRVLPVFRDGAEDSMRLGFSQQLVSPLGHFAENQHHSLCHLNSRRPSASAPFPNRFNC